MNTERTTMAQTLQEQLEIALKAVKEGKKLESFVSFGWRAYDYTDSVVTCAPHREFRIAPEPKRRPLRREELPVPCWVRQNNIDAYSLVIKTTPDEVHFAMNSVTANGYWYSHVSYEWLADPANGAEISSDCKNWKKPWVEG